MDLAEICRLAPVIPVLTVEDSGQAAHLARALFDGGLLVLEVTLRTPAALDAIGAMRDAVPDAIVGAGTVRTPADVTAALAAGARFGVSPGSSAAVLDAAEDAGLPMLPGVATPTEALVAAERGIAVLKFFPAETVGGVAALKAWAAPLAGLSFCPTGGIGPANAPDYLALPNVLCVGGSWVAPREMVREGNWNAITDLARAACGTND